MGSLTLSQMQTEVQAALGGRTDVSSRLTTFINLAQQRIARMGEFDEMQVTANLTTSNTGSANDRFLVLPLKRSLYSITILDGAQSSKLIYRTPQFWDRRIPMPEYWSRDTPRDYTVWNNTIEIYPLPDIAYTLRCRYTQWPADLVNPTDVSAYTHKDEIIIELAVIYALKSLGKEDDAAKHESKLMQLFGEAKNLNDAKPDMHILPAESDAQSAVGNVGQYWLNPFIKE